MKRLLTSKEMNSMTTNSKEQFKNSFTMRYMLHRIKRRAKQGYFSICREVLKDELELFRTNLEALGYKVTTEHDDIYNRYYLTIEWGDIK